MPTRSRDKLTKARRSWNMSRIRGRDTGPEKIVRSLLHRLGFRFRLHVRIPIVSSRDAGVRRGGVESEIRISKSETGPKSEFRKLKAARHSRPRRGLSETALQSSTLRFVRPDIVLPKYKTAIFVHGCFWHRHPGCRNCTTPTHRRDWWLAKLEGNAARDKLHQAALRKLGWRTIVVWECETEDAAWLNKRLARVQRARWSSQ